MFAVPDETGTTIGGFPGITDSTATEVFDDDQVTFDVTSAVLLSENVPVAVSWSGWVDPTETVGFAGEMVIETSGTVTVTCVEAMIVPLVAVIVVVPVASAFTIPALPAALLTVATAGEEEVQITDWREGANGPYREP
jgi:hypothetical protein